MNELIAFVEKHLSQLQSIHYFIIITIVVISVPLIYRLFRGLYQERIELKNDLIQTKNEIIDTQKTKIDIMKEEFDTIKAKNADMNKRQRSIMQSFQRISKNIARKSELEKISGNYDSVLINLTLSHYSLVKATIDIISHAKSLLVLYCILKIEQKWREAPKQWELLDEIIQIENKISEETAFLEKLKLEMIKSNSQELRKKTSHNYEAEMERLDQIIGTMQMFIDRAVEDKQ